MSLSPAATAAAFVDFDGTLSDDAWLRVSVSELSPAHVRRLDALCRAAGAVVVVASAWRCFTPEDELRAMLTRAGLTVNVAGVLGADRGPDCGRARHAEAWLDAHPEITRWVALDDEYPWEGPRWEGHVVRVDGAVGFVEADALRAAEILRARPS